MLSYYWGSLLQLDEDIVKEVLRMGFDRSHLMNSLQSRLQNDVQKKIIIKFIFWCYFIPLLVKYQCCDLLLQATVAYYLLFDKQSPTTTGYISAKFQETMVCLFLKELIASSIFFLLKFVSSGALKWVFYKTCFLLMD